jgi:serine/threonine protein kinase
MQQEAPMQPRLVVISGPDRGREFTLDEGQTLIIGRAESTATHLADPRVSRTHCQIEVDDGTFRLSDLKSRGGTRVNGRRISNRDLRPGDVIRIGHTELRFDLEGDAKATTGAGVRAVKPKPAPRKVSFSSLVGQSFAAYEIEARLATGSSGVVFRARDAEHDRTVALKILWPETIQSKEDVYRFVRAMKTMMPIRHPNIVQVYAAGRTGRHCWVAMEFVEGENLSQVIRRIGTAGMLDWRYAFRVAVDIARALQEAARHDIIHRKITPSNILMGTRDHRAKLGDLMSAKALAGAKFRRITRPGEIVGEVFCLSPEQTRSGAAVDCRSDIYALGTTVYALLTGRPPFEGGSLPAIITQIREVEPPKPKTYQLSIPDLFEGVVLRMLAKRPEQRFQTATELLVDLERVALYQAVTL